jgi:hypothetical protein
LRDSIFTIFALARVGRKNNTGLFPAGKKIQAGKKYRPETGRKKIQAGKEYRPEEQKRPKKTKSQKERNKFVLFLQAEKKTSHLASLLPKRQLLDDRPWRSLTAATSTKNIDITIS